MKNARKPWLAALLSFVLPGLGQLYNGQLNKAIWWFAAFALLCAPVAAICALWLPSSLTVPALVCALLLTLTLVFKGCRHAYIQARQQADYEPRPWQTSGMYLAAFILCSVFALPLLISYVRTHLVQAFRIPSSSMQPSVLQGDYLFADMRYNCPGCKSAIARGDVAIFTYPNDRTQTYIKRIIGLPGDRIDIANRTVSVNGKALGANVQAPSSLVTEGWEARQWQVQWQGIANNETVHLTVPDGQVFVLGDNRQSTQDSRHYGTVPLQDIRGKATQIWFSYGQHGVLWSRIGQLIR
jgi:signal peptidase I